MDYPIESPHAGSEVLALKSALGVTKVQTRSRSVFGEIGLGSAKGVFRQPGSIGHPALIDPHRPRLSDHTGARCRKYDPLHVRGGVPASEASTPGRLIGTQSHRQIFRLPAPPEYSASSPVAIRRDQ